MIIDMGGPLVRNDATRLIDLIRDLQNSLDAIPREFRDSATVKVEPDDPYSRINFDYNLEIRYVAEVRLDGPLFPENADSNLGSSLPK